MSGEHHATVGMDVSDRTTKVCVMAKEGRTPRAVMETATPTAKEGLSRFLSTQDAATSVAFETGTHCRWTNEVAQGTGFKACVADPCRLRMVTDSKAKNDRNDARTIARLAPADPGLLHPVRPRGAACQRMVNLHEMRGLLVKQRSGVIVQLRAVAKSTGFRCSSGTGLKAKGLGICARGGKIARRKAVTAVARSLAVMMAAMPKKPDAPYVPLSERCERELPAMRAMA